MIKIVNEPVTLSIEPMTRLISVKQGTNEATLSKNDVNVVDGLYNGTRTDAYTSTVTGLHFSRTPEGVLITNDEQECAVLLKKRKKGAGNDIFRIKNFMEANRPKIAWDRDFRYR